MAKLIKISSYMTTSSSFTLTFFHTVQPIHTSAGLKDENSWEKTGGAHKSF